MTIHRFIIAVVAACGLAQSSTAQVPQADTSFAAHVDLRTLGQLAAHSDGRVKSFDSLARSMMQFLSGPHKIDDRSPTFTYLDIMLRPRAYDDVEVIFVKNKLVRAEIARALRESLNIDEQMIAPEQRAQWQQELVRANARLDQFIKTGLIAPTMLSDPAVNQVLDRLSQDVVRTARFVEAVENAFGILSPNVLRANLKFIAPPAPNGTVNDPWFTIDDLSTSPNAAAALDPDLRQRIIEQWNALTKAWQEGNAPAVNDAAAQLSTLLPQVNPALYPAKSRLAWESWYFRTYNMTWVWVFYALSLVPLLLYVVFRWPAARWLGLLMFLGAFALHTFAVMLRWYVAQRWPNSNMFEAVTTAAWFGGCLAVVFEFGLWRSPMRALLALGSATASMTALMAVYFLPLELNANISNKMPVLNDIWLYIHTNVIIFSYCLIFMAAISAVLYLFYRAILALRGQGAAGAAQFAKVGGAGSLILTRPDGSTYLSENRSTFGQILDGTTMVVMEMSFILLWTGLVMGAIWADHSWGRPWGWDPKEVFALNTFIIFLLLVHVRLKVKDKGLWTALLAVVGAGVMLFNWIIINFAISGLHSYA